MEIKNHSILLSRDSKGKIRIANIGYSWNDKLNCFIIERSTGQLGGKTTTQPFIEVKAGKAKRTVKEQVILEYNSKVKKYKDKGYLDITDLGYNDLSECNPEELVPYQVTDTNGFKKPMGAKSSNDVALSTLEKEYLCSRKLDGVRCRIRANYNKETDTIFLESASRGGKNYDVPAEHILKNESLIQIFKSDPELVLDGELYIHGEALPRISGLCRKITRVPEHDELKYHVYDLFYDSEHDFRQDLMFEFRLRDLEEIKSKLKDSDPIVIEEHVETKSWTEIKSYHDKFVKEGYEGCVLRHPHKEYGFGKKDGRMIKVKEFEDAEFEILGISEGLRDEDMVFIMKCDAGTFEAKPKGSRAVKDEYRKNIDSLIGKMGTVKYFGLTPKGIPNIPVFKNVREDGE